MSTASKKNSCRRRKKPAAGRENKECLFYCRENLSNSILGDRGEMLAESSYEEAMVSFINKQHVNDRIYGCMNYIFVLPDHLTR